MSDYPAAVKRQMVRFYVSLNERDRRRYAAVEAQKLGHGSIHFISGLLKCDPKTIYDLEKNKAFIHQSWRAIASNCGGKNKVSQIILVRTKSLFYAIVVVVMHPDHTCSRRIYSRLQTV